CLLSPDAKGAMDLAAKDMLAQMTPPENPRRPRIASSLHNSTGYWIARNMPELPEGASRHVPVLSSLCPARWMYRDKSPLCVSSL
ncbi:hypothetical protein KIPB_015670, partial [Kipferlia bialata]